ncbi:hypothetical protein [uncultured Sphingomonas sp.]|nr:hypothetical protein [uncultured Sphingomonas sp.]
MTPDDPDLIRKRRQGRSLVMALLLGALVILIFFVTLSKIRSGMH